MSVEFKDRVSPKIKNGSDVKEMAQSGKTLVGVGGFIVCDRYLYPLVMSK